MSDAITDAITAFGALLAEDSVLQRYDQLCAARDTEVAFVLSLSFVSVLLG